MQSGMTASDFRALFEQHAAFVWRVLQRHGVPMRDLDDACQEVFLVLFRRSAEFAGRSSLRTWMYGIAVRVALGLRRRAYFRRELLTEQVPELVGPDDAFDDSLRSEAQALLAAALAALTRAHREVFVLYEFEDMTLAEVAATLSIPESTAVSRLYAAREAILVFVRKRERLAKSRRRDLPSPHAARLRKISAS
jgi:RNA polymerase sigma-70 factor (ECF subfamily)